MDWRITKQLFIGAEATWRDVEVPIEINHLRCESIAVFEKWKEQLHSAYLFWAPFPRVSISAQVVYDTFEFAIGSLDQLLGGSPRLSRPSAFPWRAIFRPERLLRWSIGDLCRPGGRCARRMRKLSLNLSDGKSNLCRGRCERRMEIPEAIWHRVADRPKYRRQTFRFQDDDFREFRHEARQPTPTFRNVR